MESLQETIDRAVEKMRERKAELERLRRQHTALQIELGELDAIEKEKLEALRRELEDKVICIRKLEPTFLQGVDNFLPFADHIKKREKEIETGMGKMHFFVKTTPTPTRQTLHIEGKNIIFRKDHEKKIYENPFDYVYDEIDDPKTPGEKNFTLYVKNLLADIETHNDYAGIAFGPSGTGKTTMIERVIRYLIGTFHLQIGVHQVYPRENIRIRADNEILPTEGAKESIRRGTGPRYERFEMCAVGPNDLTHVYLNDVEMINSIGNQMLEHGRAVYRILQGVNYFKCTSVDEGLTFDEDDFKAYIREEEPYSTAAGFDKMLETQVLTPVIAKINLYNNALLTLKTLLKKRLYVEREYYRGTQDQGQTDDFVLSGGFIPLHWFRYLMGSYEYDITFFDDLEKLRTLTTTYESIYLDQNPSLSIEGIDYMFRYFRFSTEEVEDLYYFPEEPADIGRQKGEIRREQERRYINSLDRSTHGTIPERAEKTFRTSEQDIEMYRKGKMRPYIEAVKRIAAQVNQAKSKLYDPKTEPFRLTNQPYGKTLKSTFIADVKKFSFQRSTPQNQTSSRCATFYLLQFKNDAGVDKRVTFIDLPGNEDQVMGCTAKEDDHLLCTETLGIRSLLTFVQNFMMVKRLNVEASEIQSVFFRSSILENLFRPLLNPNCKVGFLCFAANYAASPNYTPNTFITLNYVSALMKSSFSCVEGENLRLAKELEEKNEAQRNAYEEETKRLFSSKPELEVAVKPSGIVAEMNDVSFTLSEKIPLLIGPNLLSAAQKVVCTIKYSMTPPDNKLFRKSERIIYTCQFAGYFDFQSVNAYRFTNISMSIAFTATEVWNVETHETRSFRKENGDEFGTGYVFGYIPAYARSYKTRVIYTCYEKKDGLYFKNNYGKRIRFKAPKKNISLPLNYLDGESDPDFNIGESNFIPFKPTFFKIDYFFPLYHNNRGTIIITPTNGINFNVPEGEFFEIKMEPFIDTLTFQRYYDHRHPDYYGSGNRFYPYEWDLLD